MIIVLLIQSAYALTTSYLDQTVVGTKISPSFIISPKSTLQSVQLTFPIAYHLNDVRCISPISCTGSNNLVTITSLPTSTPDTNITLYDFQNVYYNISGTVTALIAYTDGTSSEESANFKLNLYQLDQLSYGFTFPIEQSYTKQQLQLRLIFSTTFEKTVVITFPYLNPGAQNQLKMSEPTTIPHGSADAYMIPIDNVYSPNIQYDTESVTQIDIKVQDGYYSSTKIIGFSSFFSVKKPTVGLIQSQKTVSKSTSFTFSIQPQLSYPLLSSIKIRFLSFQSSTQLASLSLEPKQGVHSSAELQINVGYIIINNAVGVSSDKAIEFKLNNFINPTHGNIQYEIEVRSPTNYLIEKSDILTALTEPEIIKTFQIKLVDTTIFTKQKIQLIFTIPNQQTKFTTLYLTIPSEITVDNYCVIIQPNGIDYQCMITGNLFTISSLFLFPQKSVDITLEFQGTLPGKVGQTSDFQLYTADANDKISVLDSGFRIQTTPNTFKFRSLETQSNQTDVITTYELHFELPNTLLNSLFTLKLPDYFSKQLTTCQHYILPCLVKNQQIEIQLTQITNLIIVLPNIRNERSVQNYFYVLDAQIIYQSLTQSILQNNDFSINLNTPQTFYNYSVKTNNMAFGQQAQWSLQFSLNSTLKATDKLAITFPQAIVVQFCSPICTYSQGVYYTSIDKTNNITVTITNPTVEKPLYPFYYQVSSIDNTVIAEYTDQIGIRESFAIKKCDFDFDLSSTYYKDYTTLILKFNSQVDIPSYGKGRLNYNLNILGAYNISCDTVRCEQLKQDEKNHLQFVTFQPMVKGTDYIIKFNGLLLVSGIIGDIEINMNFQIFDEFNNLRSSSDLTKTFAIKCSEQCVTCKDRFDYCTQCPQNKVQYKYECLDGCPDKYIKVADKCIQCLTPTICLTCSSEDPRKCLECQNNYTLIDGYCIQNQLIPSHTKNSTNNDQPTKQDNQIEQAQDQIKLYDGIPFYLIAMAVMLLITTGIKLRYKKDIIFFRTFYTLISCMEIFVTVLRLIRFAFLGDGGYLFLSISCLFISLYFQISNATVLQTMMKTDITFAKYCGRKKYLKQAMLVFQWRLVLSIIPAYESKKLKYLIYNLFKGQILIQLVPISVILSYLITNQFQMFILDDLLYNCICITIALFSKKWIIIEESNNTTIFPSQNEFTAKSRFQTDNP